MGPDLKDIRGVQIEVGDTVAYGISCESPTLRMGVVVDLIPYPNRRTVENPYFDPTQPQTYGSDKTNPRWIAEEFTDLKIKVKQPDKPYRNSAGLECVEKGKTQTYDRPRRFAVLQKA